MSNILVLYSVKSGRGLESTQRQGVNQRCTPYELKYHNYAVVGWLQRGHKTEQVVQPDLSHTPALACCEAD